MKIDVAVVGGGIIGWSIAYELIRHNKTVLVIEKSNPGQASWAAAGMLPDIGSAQQTDRFERFRQLANEKIANWSERLLKETGVDNQYWKCGSLFIALDAIELASINGMANEFESNEVKYRELSSSQLVELFPKTGQLIDVDKVCGALFAENDSQIDARQHLTALKQCVQHSPQSNTISEKHVHLNQDQYKNATLFIDHEQVDCELICVAAGAWSNELLSNIDCPIDLVPVRGQMFRFFAEQAQLETIVQNNARYLVPRKSGEILVGSTIEEVGFNADTSADAIDELAGFAEQVIPDFKRCWITEKWTGLRPAVAQSVPIIGKVGNYSNLLLATGHFRGGIQLSAISAEMAVELMYPNTSKRPEAFAWANDSIFKQRSKD